jgi:Flp pilus assembly protein TadB
MDKLEAAALIKQQRRRWQSQESDRAIAERAERAYFGLAMMYVCIAISLALLLPTLTAKVMAAAGFVFCAVILYLQSRRFAQVRKFLAASDAKPDSS